MLVFHLSTDDEWREALARGSYDRSTRGRSLAEVGFVHCAFADQVAGVHEAFYADVDEPLVLLTVDTDRTGVPCRVEEGFPHLYGAIPCGAVREATPFPRLSQI
ncbi:MAG: DUF952 domain-containing protein [Nocardioidaceae bacterium]